MLKGINWISVIIAFVALEVLGYVWYAVVFKDAWATEMAAIGLKPDMNPSAQTASLAIGAVLIIVEVLGIAWLTRKLEAMTLMGGLTTAFTAYVFFALTTQGMEFAYMGFSLNLMGINCGQLLLSYLLAGAIMGGLKFGKPAEAAAA